MLLVLQVLILIVSPAILIALQKQVSWAKPIVMAYVLGVFFGNIVPNWFHSGVLHEITGISVILAIPLLLFPTKLSDWRKQPKSMVKAYAIAAFSTVVAVSLGYVLFIDEVKDLSLVSAMVTGVYTGGTVNLNAIGIAFEVPTATILLLNGYDMMVSGAYLLVLFLIGKPLAFKLLGNKASHVDLVESANLRKIEVTDYFSSMGLSVLVVGFVAGLSMLLTGALNEMIMVFGVSILGVLLANWNKISSIKSHMPVADYLMILFGVCLGLQANAADLLGGSIPLMKYFLTVFGVILLVHYTLSKILKVDGYESIIASVAAIFGPPFIGPVAKALDREVLIPSGIAVALIGNAIGTYLGMAVAYFMA